MPHVLIRPGMMLLEGIRGCCPLIKGTSANQIYPENETLLKPKAVSLQGCVLAIPNAQCHAQIFATKSCQSPHPVCKGRMREGWPFCHHLATAHQDPEQHEILKPPVDDKIIDLQRKRNCQFWLECPLTAL